MATPGGPDDLPWAEWERAHGEARSNWNGPGPFPVYPPVPAVPLSVQLGHAASLGWASLWVLVGLRGGDTPWGGLIAAVGGLITLLVLVARLESARAWLLLQVLTVVVMVCCVGSLFAEPREAGASPTSAGAVARPDGGADDPGDEDPRFVALTAALQLGAVTALNWRSSRTWHGVDPPGWRTFFDR